MNSMPLALKSLLIYLICIPLALFLGFQVTDLAYLSRDSMLMVGAVLLVLITPLLLKWHRPLTFFFLNASAYAFFLPGRPKLGLVLVAISLMISVLQRTVQHRSRFIRAPEIQMEPW